MKHPERVLRITAITTALLIGSMVVVEATRKPETTVWCIEGEAKDGNLQSAVEETAKRHGVYLSEGVAETLGRIIKHDIELGSQEQVGAQGIWIGLSDQRRPVTAGPGNCEALGVPQLPTQPN